ncbi:aldo/keto reductase [Actinocrispum sp. NPDC049592]|uniref:aldo/keto reductase n=1 Tax=Actinocrispum sp. NPDC049592 TaxID=3154835 RepID=UPI003438AB9D
MRRIELAQTGQVVSQVALGCMVFGTLTDEQTSFRILDSFLDDGGDFLDTANCYAWWTSPEATGDESEELLGRYLTGKRDKVFLATKCAARVADTAGALAAGSWPEREGFYEGAAPDTVRHAVEDSLRRLRTDYVDLLYIHVDLLTTPVEETLQALDSIVRSGKVRYIGWSNTRSWRLELIRSVAEHNGWAKPVAVQQQHSYLRPNPAADLGGKVGPEMLHYLAHHKDIALVPYSPILRGLYEHPERLHTPDWQDYAGPDSEERLAKVAKVAQELGVTNSQVVLAWLLHQGTFPIVGPRTWDHWTAYRPAFDLELTPEQLALLR